MNFEDPHLLAHYKGSWVRAQVAFYDFLFETSSTMTPEEFRKESMKAVTTGEFSDGTEFYEAIAARILKTYPTVQEAWTAFLAREFRR